MADLAGKLEASPSHYKITEIIEGDGKFPGSLIKATLDLGSELSKTVITERIEGVDDAKRTIIYSVIDSDLLNNKSYKGYISVTPKVDNNGGSIVKWSCDYEKASQDYKLTISFPNVIDGDLLKDYKSYKGYVNVTPKGDDDGSLVKWSCEYEKASQDVTEPTFMREAAINIFLKLDDYILNA
ncbi:hypothetical protein PIB30_065631 [Stylosanthes scabra]|uniref:Bet v I/Major latex protein domain-containing protein n=1 Tax=Stylosanthes scabra TaxID=79078 RepID=A0ABU6YKY5_9FABA|nr:hypothetical protein [Stylosanthes scabra]